MIEENLQQEKYETFVEMPLIVPVVPLRIKKISPIDARKDHHYHIGTEKITQETLAEQSNEGSLYLYLQTRRFPINRQIFPNRQYYILFKKRKFTPTSRITNERTVSPYT